MNITQNNVSKLNSTIQITISKEDYLPAVSAALKKYSKQATIKGFRPGQVPAGVIKKMHGNGILADELNRMIDENMGKYIQENKLEILGQPIPTESSASPDIDINADKEYSFEFEIGLQPEFEINYATEPFEKQMVEASQEAIDNEVSRLRKRFGAVADTNAITEEEDLVYITLSELDEQNKIKEEGFTNSTIVSFKDVVAAKKSDFKLLTVDGQIQINPLELFDSSKINVLKYIVGLEEEAMEGKNPMFNLKVTKITTMNAAELNEEFFAKATGGDEAIKTEEDFKAKIKSSIEGYYNQQSEGKLSQDIFDKIVKDTQIDLPVDFLKRWIKKTNEKPLTDEIIDKEFNGFSRELKWDLISGKIARENDIKVDAEEIKNEIRNRFINQLYQYGMTYFTEPQIEEFVDKQMKDKKTVQGTFQALLDMKVLETVKSKISVKEMKMTEEAFNEDTKMRQNRQQATMDQSASYSEVEATDVEEGKEENGSILGNVKNFAGKLFGGK